MTNNNPRDPRMNTCRFICHAVAAALAMSLPAAALEAQLTVRETAGVARSGGIVSCGVPFAKATVKDLSKLSVSVGGKPAAAQFRMLAPWDDGSVRWALGTFAADVPAGGAVEIVVRDDGRNVPPAKPVKVDDGRTAVKVSTGPMQFRVSKKSGDLFQVLELDGKPVLTAKGRGLVLYPEKGEAVVAGLPAEVALEESGPMRAVVRVRGPFPGVHNGLLSYTLRLTAYAGGKALYARVWIENNGAHGYKAQPEWFHFDGLAVELAPAIGQPIEASCEGVTASGKLSVLQMCPAAKWTNFAFKVTGDGRELAKGQRTDGVVELKGPAGRLTTAIRHFWQNYDKAIELDGEVVKLWLWPTEAQWPRPENLGGGGDGSLKDSAYTRPGLNALPGGVHKGHEFVLDFSGRAPPEVSAELSTPLTAASPDYFAETEAANGLFAPTSATSGHEELDWKLRFWGNMAANLVNPDGKGGLPYVRTVGNERGSVWFGWMDFGDVCSPSGGWYGGGVTPRNLHYDWTWVVLLQYLRTGDRTFLELGTEMARHQMEIDQNWSDRDDPRARFLLRPDNPSSELHTSKTTPEPEQNWLSGIVLYYQLTGDSKARECALRNYEGLQERMVKRMKARPDDNVYIHYSLLTLQNLLSLHSMTGEPKYLDDIGAVLSGHLLRRFRDAGPFLYEPRLEIRQQDYHMLGKQYCYGVAALCEYHYRTGDERVGKMLAEACAYDFPETFYEAPLYLADLYAYVGYMTGNEDLLTRAMESFANGFPESRHPPVYHAGEKDWTERSAMMLRAGNLLQYAVWRTHRPGQPPLAAKPGARELMLDRSSKAGAAAAVVPAQMPDGSLVLDVKAFALKDCDVQEMAGALGGKAVLLRQFTSSATADVPLKAGKYELVILAHAPGDENDAFNLTVDGDQSRVYPAAFRTLSPTRPVSLTVAKDRSVRIRISASEENGMSVDRVILKPLP